MPQRSETKNESKSIEIYCDCCGELLSPDDLQINCDATGVPLGEGIRHVLTEIIQKLDTSNQNKLVVEVADVTYQGYFHSQKQALATAECTLIDYYGSKLGPKWTNKISVDRCVICGSEVNHHEWHQALLLTVESGPKIEPEIHAGVHLACFCPTCVPLHEGTEALDVKAANSGCGLFITKNQKFN